MNRSHIAALAALLVLLCVPNARSVTKDKLIPVAQNPNAIASIAAYEEAKGLQALKNASATDIHRGRLAIRTAWNKWMRVKSLKLTEKRRTLGPAYDYDKDTIKTSDGVLTLAAYHAKVKALQTALKNRPVKAVTAARYKLFQTSLGKGKWTKATLSRSWDKYLVHADKVSKKTELPKEFAPYLKELAALTMARETEKGTANAKVLSMRVASNETTVTNKPHQAVTRATFVYVYISGDVKDFEFVRGTNWEPIFIRFKK